MPLTNSILSCHNEIIISIMIGNIIFLNLFLLPCSIKLNIIGKITDINISGMNHKLEKFAFIINVTNINTFTIIHSFISSYFFFILQVKYIILTLAK